MRITGTFVFCLLASLLAISPIKTDEAVECPTDIEIANPTTCKCYSSVGTMICTDLTKSFELTKDYHLNKLQIKNSQNLYLLTEHVGNVHLNVDNLIISQDANSPKDLPTLDHLEKVLKVTTKSIKIVSEKDLPNQVLDVSFLSSELTSLSINSVASLDGFEFGRFGKLEKLQLHDVKFMENITNVELYDSALTHVEITNTMNLDGKFLFSPKDCKANQKIHIDLQDTKGLVYFDFTHLFKPDHSCHYHIDLSGTTMSPNLLTSQVAILDNQTPGSFYLILSGVPKLECSCELYKLYHKDKLANYIHSVHCEKQGKYLDQLIEKEACPDPQPHNP